MAVPLDRTGVATLVAALWMLAAPSAIAQTTGPGGPPPIPRHALGDLRQPVVLDAGQRALVLQEMRDFLVAVQSVLSAAIVGDMPRVTAAARAVGLSHFAADPADQRAVYKAGGTAPPAFRELGAATHAAFDAIATTAESSGDSQAVLRQLSDNLGRCTACHAAYRMPEGAPARQTTLPPRTIDAARPQ